MSPAKSEAQRRFIYGVKGKAFAKAHGFDNRGKLPARVGRKKTKAKAKRKAKARPTKRAAKKRSRKRRGRS